MKKDTEVEKRKTMAVVEFTGYNVEEVQHYLSATLDFITNGSCKVSVVSFSLINMQ